MHCSHCGKILTEDARFCSSCGMTAALGTDAAVVVEPSRKEPEPPVAERPMRRTEAEFRAFYDTVLLPELALIDRDRKSVRTRVAIFWLATALAIVALFAVGDVLDRKVLSEGTLTVLCAVVGIGGFGAWFALLQFTRRKANAFLSRFKTVVIGGILRFIAPSLVYDPDACVNRDRYNRSGLFPQDWETYDGDDHVSGKLGKTSLEFSELHTMMNVAGEDERKKYRTVFHGLFFVCEFSKTFLGRTYVLPDKLEGRLGELGSALQRGKTRFGELVKLEDPEFERRFAVYGSDQATARYVLSTSLMERLTAFRKKTRQDLRLAFVDSDLYVAVCCNRNLFEPRIWRTLLTFKGVHAYFEDLQLVVGIVDDLNLNTRIWGERALQI